MQLSLAVIFGGVLIMSISQYAELVLAEPEPADDAVEVKMDTFSETSKSFAHVQPSSVRAAILQCG